MPKCADDDYMYVKGAALVGEDALPRSWTGGCSDAGEVSVSGLQCYALCVLVGQ